MRGSDLLGLPVRGPAGERLGEVLDVRLVQDGPLLGAYAALRVQGLVVGRRLLLSHLGYDRAGISGPWLVSALVRRMTADNRFLPWDEATVADGEVRSARAELERVKPLGELAV